MPSNAEISDTGNLFQRLYQSEALPIRGFTNQRFYQMEDLIAEKAAAIG